VIALNMRSFVLGAGASRHAGFPLASQLGPALWNWVHHNRPPEHSYRIHVGQLQDIYGGLGDIEMILTDLDECRPGSRAASLERPIRGFLLGDLRLSIREFFQDLQTHEAALYRRLAREQVKPGDAVVTFNYDVACERQLKEAGRWEISDGYGFSLGLESVPPSDVKVFKLHGSTNWWGLFFRGAMGFGQASDLLGPRPTIFFRCDFDFLGYREDVCDPECSGIRRSGGIPAIVMPTSHKRFFEQTSFGREWEPFWESLWHQASQALQSSDEIILVGYSMRAIDLRARELLLEHGNHHARIMVYFGEDSATICETFRARGFSCVESHGGGLFEDFIGAD